MIIFKHGLIIVLLIILAENFIITTVNANNVSVEVGKGGLKFVPQKVTVSNGDIVIFKFVNPNIPHSVVQSDSEKSCTRSTKTNVFDSKVNPPSDFIVNINQESGALYYYCSEGSHCSIGMWGVINIQAPSNTSSNSPTNSPTPTDSPKSGATESSSTSITLVTFIVLFSSLFMAMFMA